MKKQSNLKSSPYIGEFISEVRRTKRLTRETLAELLGVDSGRLGRWERGVHKFPVDILPLVAQILNEDIVFTKSGEIKIGNGEMEMTQLNTSIREVLELEEMTISRQVLLTNIEKAFDLVDKGLATENSKGSLYLKIEIEGETKSFENNLYTNPDQTLYLLESRLFDEKTDAMEGVFLEVYQADLSIYSEEAIDDVWSLDEWKLVE